jgi:predicted RNA methylase
MLNNQIGASLDWINVRKSFTRLIFSVRRVIAAKGIVGLIDMAWRRLLHRPVISEPRLIEHPFDIRYGVQTSGYVTLPTKKDQFAYYGVNPSVFREVCSRWVATLNSPEDLERYCFIDLGSGLGRALLLASEFRFREVIGVELDATLAVSARKNIEIWNAGGHAHAPIRVEHADVRDFQFPASPVLIFLYNPFGEDTMLEILARLEDVYKVSSSTVDILYCYPKYGYIFNETDRFDEIWMAPIALDQEDRVADAFYSKVEVCCEYRLSVQSQE